MSESDADRAVCIARSILDGSTPVFLGCKQLFGPLCRLGVRMDDEFVIITALESELDAFPVWPDERSLWNTESLAREDATLAEWLPHYREPVFEACRAVIRRFGGGEP